MIFSLATCQEPASCFMECQVLTTFFKTDSDSGGFQDDGTKPLLTTESFNIPETLSEGEVLVKLVGATICNSDIHTLLGRRQEPTPGVLGHEGCGAVVRSARSGVSVGDQVTFSVTQVCGGCERCRHGPQQKCVQLTKIGHTQYLTRDQPPRGCYSTHILLGPGTAVVTIPPVLDTCLAAPVNCALATMVAARRVARHAMTLGGHDPTPERSVLIYGAGLLGLYGAALFKEDDFTVYVSDPVKERLAQAVEFGAEESAPSHKVDLVVEVKHENVSIKISRNKLSTLLLSMF